MPSEYDFLSPYSRRLRRAGLATIGVGAFVAGAVAMAAIVALPLVPLGGRDTTPPTEARPGAAQEPAQAVIPAATTPSLSATARDTAANAPESPTPDTAGRRETTGIAGASAPASSGNPSDTKPAAPASSDKDTSAAAPPVPAASTQTPQSAANGGASAGETSAPSAHAATRSPDSASTPARAAPGGEASPPAKKKSTASRTRRAQSERVARSRQREEYRSTRAFGERRAGREYVDGSGVRYFVVPRSAESAFAYDDAPRTRRLIIVRPGGAFDDDD